MRVPESGDARRDADAFRADAIGKAMISSTRSVAIISAFDFRRRAAMTASGLAAIIFETLSTTSRSAASVRQKSGKLCHGGSS